MPYAGRCAMLSDFQGADQVFIAITPRQYRWLMEGLTIEQPKAHHDVTGYRVE